MKNFLRHQLHALRGRKAGSQDSPATLIELRRPVRFNVSGDARRPIILCLDHGVRVGQQGVVVAGWMLDPTSQVSKFLISVEGQGAAEPFASGGFARPDVISSFRKEFASLGVKLALNHKVGFCQFLPTGTSPIVTTIELHLNDHAIERFEFEPASDQDSIKSLVQHESGHLSPVVQQIAEGPLPDEWREAFEGRLEAPAVPPSQQVPTPASSASTPLTAEALEVQIQEIQNTGLFDEKWYLKAYPDVSALAVSPLRHYCEIGWREGRQPVRYFDTRWYLEGNADIRDAGVNPFWHYAVAGDREGRWPCPYFDPSYYRATYPDAVEAPTALKHYLDLARKHQYRSPVPHFSPDYYLATYPDVRQARIDPMLHYIDAGHAEGRDPCLDFETNYYRNRYLRGELSINPLVHYYQAGREKNHFTKPGPHDADDNIAAQIRKWVNRGDEFEDFNPRIAAGVARKAKLMAFYLPQFHSFAQNDLWWGKGFTEWNNVARGVPRYAGHHQPRVPRDLGYYNLTDPEVIRRQVEMAKAAGLHGWCFYYYWFNRERLLEKPLDMFVADKSLDLPFCLMWANENWTRRWDGMESEVLIHQEYDERDHVALVDDLQRYFSDPRYLRAEGRPLLFIYRLDIIPDAAKTIETWRAIWKERYNEEPLIFLTQAFDNEDPRDFGLDGAIEFPPHKITRKLQRIDRKMKLLDPYFQGQVFSYDDVVNESVADVPGRFPLIKTAVPAWDNDGRRQGKGLSLAYGNPAKYEAWLRGLIDIAVQNPVYGESLVFINAWNEWGEAAYLEPDVHYGSAYLNATARAVCGRSKSEAKRKVLLVGHDALRHGAQALLLHIAETLVRQFGCEVGFVLLRGGEMAENYRRYGEVAIASGTTEDLKATIRHFAEKGFRAAVTNTTVTGRATPLLKHFGFSVISLIHELPRIIREYGLESSAREIAQFSDAVVFPARQVASSFTSLCGDIKGRSITRPQGVYKRFKPSPEGRERVREELGIPQDGKVVLNVGYADLRKGIDIFVDTARRMVAADDRIHFVWLGKTHHLTQDWIIQDLDENLKRHIHFVDYTEDVAAYYQAADVFFLSSREDPFPSVALEALQVGLPLVAFRDSGGMEDLAERFGQLIDRNRPEEIDRAIRECVKDASDTQLAEGRKQTIAERFRFDDYCFDLLQLLDPDLKKVSVVVPNYNYEKYLGGRLSSIFDQTYPIFELIVLDDCSSDSSLDALADIAQQSGRKFEVVTNSENAGSAFRQWVKGAERASGDLLWIAEADDLSKADFLERVVAAFGEEEMAFAFSDSSQLDQNGRPLGDSYRSYYRTAAGDFMDHDLCVDGEEFVRRCLTQKNLVLNVSAVVWNRRCLAQVLEKVVDDLVSYKLAGDWHLYVAASLSGRKVAYIGSALNIHRRHQGSVTGALDKQRHLDEIVRVHEVMKTCMKLSDESLASMDRYVEEIRLQFGLIDADAAEAANEEVAENGAL